MATTSPQTFEVLEKKPNVTGQVEAIEDSPLDVNDATLQFTQTDGNNSYTTTPDPSGTFAQRVEPGSYNVEVTRPPFKDTSGSVTTTEADRGTDVPLNFLMEMKPGKMGMDIGGGLSIG